MLVPVVAASSCESQMSRNSDCERLHQLGFFFSRLRWNQTLSVEPVSVGASGTVYVSPMWDNHVLVFAG